MNRQIDSKTRLVTVRQALGAVLLFCFAQQAAAQLDPRYGAVVELFNLAPYSYAGQRTAGGSVTTGVGGAVLTEGGAGFSGSPAINVNVTTVLGREATARAYIFDTLTFDVASGGSALVPVRMAGRWGGLGGTVTASLGLGQGGNLPAVIYSGNGYASEYPLEPGSGFTRSGNMVDGYVGSYVIEALWSVYDGAVLSLLVQVGAASGGGGHVYIDDPITIDLPAGVTFTSTSNSTYASVVPEPSTWLLFGGGISAIAWLRRRAQQRTQASQTPSHDSPEAHVQASRLR